MSDAPTSLSASDTCRLSLRTGVTGKAAKMGHRLTIAVTEWEATVEWSAGVPSAVYLSAVTGSIEVLGGEGGITPLLGPEKILARSNALKALDARKFPRIRFVAGHIEKVNDGFRLAGTLEIHGTTRDHTVDLQVEDTGPGWRLSMESEVCQTDFGVKPYSQLMGAMKVVDAVTVSLDAEVPKES